MSEKWTNRQVAEYLMDEAIGYAIRSGVGSDRLEDEYLAKLWDNAAVAMQEIINYLKEWAPDLDDYI